MKRQAFVKELEQAGCVLVRHGRRHDVYRNPANGRQAPVPRHRDIADTHQMHADQALTELIYNASVRAFEDWREAPPNERVFAFALSTLDDAMYVSASLNSEESHQRRLKERQLEPSSAYALDTKWGPWEWENEYTDQSHFGVVDDRLQQMYDECSEDSFAAFRSTVFDSMLQALLKLRENGIVINDGDASGIVMFATIYDSFDAESLHRRSAELLNPPETAAELLAVIGG